MFVPLDTLHEKPLASTAEMNGCHASNDERDQGQMNKKQSYLKVWICCIFYLLGNYQLKMPMQKNEGLHPLIWTKQVSVE
jgi:hypothetical protein